MNSYEIDSAVDRYADHPTLGPAARTLRNLHDAVNRCSDGWAYWPAPVRAAKNLMTLLTREMDKHWLDDLDTPGPTAAEVTKTLTPVKAFRTRTGIDFTIEPAA